MPAEGACRGWIFDAFVVLQAKCLQSMTAADILFFEVIDMTIEEKLSQLGITLPEAAAPAAMYVPVRQSGNILFVSGQIPVSGGVPVFTGKAGGERSLEDAQSAARLCAINLLAAVKAHLGSLERVKNVLKLQIFVNSAPGFSQQHLVANGASQVMADVFGDAGKHARTAVGVPELPMDVTVEVEAMIEV